MIDLRRCRKVVTQIIQLRIGRRDQVRIESSQLNFAFPLMANEIVGWGKWHRDQSQNYRDTPENHCLAQNVDPWRKMRNRREEGYSTGTGRSHKTDWHLLKRPVIKQIQ